jgi:hypothetical protein
MEQWQNRGQPVVTIYIEGGGDERLLKDLCRKGFRLFLEKAGFKGKMPALFASGSRQKAYDDFNTAVENGEDALLLVDSEGPVNPENQADPDKSKWKPWDHLTNRKGDETWKKPPGSNDTQCHLMVQMMEHWLLADREKLAAYYGPDFKMTKLPAQENEIETLPKDRVQKSLKDATNDTQKKSYSKGQHSFEILAQIDPTKVIAASPWAKRFIDELNKVMSSQSPGKTPCG